MTNKDYQNIFQYKLILPIMCTLCLASLFFGPFYFPVINQILCVLLIFGQSYKAIMFGLISIHQLIQTNKVLDKSLTLSSLKQSVES
jgi:hypothetical protein